MITAQKKLSITLITGFLGAGKTTLISKLMKQKPQWKFGIIENEFADQNIDSEILEQKNQDQIWLERTSGCLCCQVEGELLPQLGNLISKSPEGLDHLIIETTGLADPNAIIAELLRGQNQGAPFQLDGVSCLVDAQFFLKHYQNREELPELTRQMISATQILITKHQGCAQATLKEIQTIITQLNPEASCHLVESGDISSESVLQQQAFNLQKLESFFEKKFLSLTKSSSTSFELLKHNAGPKRGVHGLMKSWCLEKEGELNPQVFELFLNITFAKAQSNLLRCKGILCFQDQPHKVLFHSIYDQFQFELGGPWKDGEKRLNQIVLIGQEDMQILWERGLENCLKKI